MTIDEAIRHAEEVDKNVLNVTKYSMAMITIDFIVGIAEQRWR